MKTKKKTKKPAPPSVTVQNCEFAGVKFDANVTSLLGEMVHVLQTATGAIRDTVQLFTGINHSNEAMLKIVKPDEEGAIVSYNVFTDNAKKKA